MNRSAVTRRSWFRRYSAGLTAGAAAVIVVAFAVLLWRGAGWLYGPGLHALTPDQQVTAIDDVRGRLIQLGAGLLAAGALLYTARTFRLSREGHVTDRYTKAIEQLGSERLDVRLGAIYALERIMIDSRRDHPTIVEVLAAYVREHSPSLRPEDQDPDTELDPPATDVQAVLTVLGRRPADREERGRLNLRYTRLANADLAYANLTDADLKGAQLTHADLLHANLTGANLTDANLVRACLIDANLTHACLIRATLTDARLVFATLKGTNLSDATLTRAVLTQATLTEAILIRTTLIDAHLPGVNLTKAHFHDAVLTGANLKDATLPVGYAGTTHPDPGPDGGSSSPSAS